MHDDALRRGPISLALLKKLEEDWEESIRLRTLEGWDINDFIKRDAAYSWTKHGLDYWLCHQHTLRHWSGYVRFPSRPVKEPGCSGLLMYVPVHGGITWARSSPDGTFVYGFDCGHADDMLEQRYAPGAMERRLRKFKRTWQQKDLVGPYKRRTLRWLVGQVEGMAAGIIAAARLEKAYNAVQYPEDLPDNPDLWSVEQKAQISNANAHRSKVIEQLIGYMDSEGFPSCSWGTSAMLSILSGQL